MPRVQDYMAWDGLSQMCFHNLPISSIELLQALTHSRLFKSVPDCWDFENWTWSQTWTSKKQPLRLKLAVAPGLATRGNTSCSPVPTKMSANADGCWDKLRYFVKLTQVDPNGSNWRSVTRCHQLIRHMSTSAGLEAFLWGHTRPRGAYGA